MSNVSPEFELAAEDIASQILAVTDRSKQTVTKAQTRWRIDDLKDKQQIESYIDNLLNDEL